MKTIPIIAILATLVISGCSSQPETTATNAPETSKSSTSGLKAISYEKGSKKKGDQGVCAVCMIKEGKQPAEEEVKVVMDYKDRTYIFCNEAEEAEFISDPKKYAGE